MTTSSAAIATRLVVSPPQTLTLTVTTPVSAAYQNQKIARVIGNASPTAWGTTLSSKTKWRTACGTATCAARLRVRLLLVAARQSERPAHLHDFFFVTCVVCWQIVSRHVTPIALKTAGSSSRCGKLMQAASCGAMSNVQLAAVRARLTPITHCIWSHCS